MPGPQASAPTPAQFGLTGSIAPKPSGETRGNKGRTVTVSKRGGEGDERNQGRKESDEDRDADLDASDESDADNDSEERDPPRRKAKAKARARDDGDEEDSDGGDDSEDDDESNEEDDSAEEDGDDEDDEGDKGKRKAPNTEGKTRKQLSQMLASLSKKLDAQTDEIANLRRNPPRAEQRNADDGGGDKGGTDDLALILGEGDPTGEDADKVVTQGEIALKEKRRNALKAHDTATRNKAAQQFQDYEIESLLKTKDGGDLYKWLREHGDEAKTKNLRTVGEVVLEASRQRMDAVVKRMEKKHAKEIADLKRKRGREPLDDIPTTHGRGGGGGGGGKSKANGRGLGGAFARLSQQQGLTR